MRQQHQLQIFHTSTIVRMLASPSHEATTSAADLSHINNSKNESPSCPNDTSHDLQVQVLLSDIESKLISSLASMITQALVSLHTFVVDQFNALSNKIRILEEDLRHRLDQLEAEVNCTRQSKAQS